MSIVKLNNRSVKDITQFGSISSLGSLTHIATQTASSSSSINFTSGIDSTYKEYIFYFVNIHPATDSADIMINFSIDGGSNYNVTKTGTHFRAYHDEGGSATSLAYDSSNDIAQGTGDLNILLNIGNGNDECGSGFLHLFDPSNTTFVKHYTAQTHHSHEADLPVNFFKSGYGNTTSAVDAIQFSMSSGNIDSGDIVLYGIN